MELETNLNLISRKLSLTNIISVYSWKNFQGLLKLVKVKNFIFNVNINQNLFERRKLNLVPGGEWREITSLTFLFSLWNKWLLEIGKSISLFDIWLKWQKCFECIPPCTITYICSTDKCPTIFHSFLLSTCFSCTSLKSVTCSSQRSKNM